jgi:hypothetical protein
MKIKNSVYLISKDKKIFAVNYKGTLSIEWSLPYCYKHLDTPDKVTAEIFESQLGIIPDTPSIYIGKCISANCGYILNCVAYLLKEDHADISFSLTETINTYQWITEKQKHLLNETDRILIPQLATMRLL